MRHLRTVHKICIWTADGYEPATVTSSCDFLLGLLAGTDQPDTEVWTSSDNVSPCPVSGSAIESFLTKSNDNLTWLHFHSCILKEGHFQGFTNAPAREGVGIVLKQCVIDAYVEPLVLDYAQKGRGPNKLWNCVIDPIVLGHALTTSNRIKTLVVGKRQWNNFSFRALCQSVAESKSIMHFHAFGMYISDENWSVLCKIFRPHPTLKWLKLDLNRQPHGVSKPQMTVERIERRMNDVLSMLHVNSVLGVVELVEDDSGAPRLPQNMLDKTETRLEMNMSAFEEQCQSLGPLVPDLRPKLLGRALHMARLHPKLLWKFLSEHLDVVVETADERIISKLDAVAQKKRKLVDLRDAQNKRLKREAS